MRPKQIVVNAKQVIKGLETKDFMHAGYCGSQAIYQNKNDLRVTGPIHGKKDIALRTSLQILADAKLSFDELKDLI